MKKHIITLTAATLLSLAAIAQPRFGDEMGVFNYRNNEMLINPAYAGTHSELSSIGLGVDMQWANIDGAPFSQSLQFQSPLLIENSGLGLTMYNSTDGGSQRLQANAVYSYQVRMRTGTLSLGLQLGILTLGQKSVEVLDPEDPMFKDTPSRKWSYNAGVGAYYYTDKYYVGFSIPQLMAIDIEDAGNKLSNKFDFSRMQYYFTGGYVFNIDEDFDVMPSALMVLSGSTDFGYEVMATGIYKQRLRVGLGFATHNNIQATAGAFVTNSIYLSYRYQQSLGDTYNGLPASHQVTLGIYWGKLGTSPKFPLF